MFSGMMEEEERRVRRRAKWAVGLAALGLALILAWPALRERLFNEDAWRGPYVAARGLGADEADGVPWRQVHEALLPGWIVAIGQGEDAEEEAFQRLARALEPDDQLRSLAVALREFAREPAVESEALFDLSNRWSRLLDERGHAWRIEAGIAGAGSRAFFYVKTYEVVADGRARVGEAEHRVRLLRRADTLNVVEGWLGHTKSAEEGGLVVIKRIVDFAADDLWPALADDPADPDPLRRAFAPLLLAEARALPEEALELLRETAPARLRMRLAREAVLDRSGCSQVSVPRLPWFGFDLRGRESLEALVEPYGQCPMVKPEEARDLVDGSLTLRRTRGLDHAVAQLAAWVARGVAVHELRHAADMAGGDPGAVDAELSAYLASFSTDGLAAVSLFQACVANQEGWSAHAAALTQAGIDCLNPPPDIASAARARALELGLPNAPIALPDGFADTVPLPGE